MLFSKLKDGQFFGTREIDCMAGCIFMKCSRDTAVVVWDVLFGECVGRQVQVPNDIQLRETYHLTLVDAQTNDPEGYTFTRDGAWGE